VSAAATLTIRRDPEIHAQLCIEAARHWPAQAPRWVIVTGAASGIGRANQASVW